MNAQILVGDVRQRLAGIANASVQCVVTSPPYWGLRDYGVADQIGLEVTPDVYVSELVSVFQQVRRMMTDDATLWLNLGDSYVATPRGNKRGEFSTSSLTNPQRQDCVSRGGVSRNRGSVGSDLPQAPHRQPCGLVAKQLVGIPWRVAFALQADGWYLRSDIIWSKPNPMPESVTDRPTKAHEYLFQLSKSKTYYYDAEAIKEPYAESTQREIAEGYDGEGTKDYAAHGVQNPSDVKRRIIEGARRKNEATGDRRKIGLNDRWDARTNLHQNARAAGETRNDYNFRTGSGRNKRSVWTIPTQPFPGAHFAVMPEALVEPCILAGSRIGDLICDPFCGTGTVGVVALRHLREFVGIELNPSYAEMARLRIQSDAELLNMVTIA